jgi:fructan beta-fructosidase
VDTGNTAGFGKNAMVAMFTHHNDKMEKAGSNVHFSTSLLAYSTDGGKTFAKYAGNPVVKNPGIRDFQRSQGVVVCAGPTLGDGVGGV